MTLKRRARGAALLALAVAAAPVATALAMATSPIPAGGASKAAPVNTPSLTLASQTPWVGPGQQFQMRVSIGAPITPSATLTVTVFSAVQTRSEFTRTLEDHISEAILGQPRTVQVASMVPDAAGARTIVMPIQDPAKARDPSQLYLPRSGVYPVQAEYRRDNTAAKVVLVTHMLYMSGPISGAKLDVASILSVHAPPQADANGVDVLTAEQSDRLAALASALDNNRAVPVAIRPTPETVAALASSHRPQDALTLSVLSRPDPLRQLLAGTYVPVPLPGLLAAGLSADATSQLTAGSAELASALNVRPDTRTWVESGPMDGESARFLRSSQVDRMVVPEAALSPNPLSVTLAQPFNLSVPPVGHPEGHVLAASADAALGAHMLNRTDPILAAHQLLADLTVVYLDTPGLTRGVVIDAPDAWRPDANFLGVFFSAMTSSPVLAGVTLDTLFASVPVATVRGRQPMTRTLAHDTRTSVDAATFPVESIHATRRRLNEFASAVRADNPLVDRIGKMLLAAEARDLPQLRDRRAQVDRVNHRIDQELWLLQLPKSRRITLTSKRGQLPIAIQSGADYPMRVVLRVESDKLSFPGNPSTGSATTAVDLHRGNNRVVLEVSARTTGSFPLHITVLSPDGRLRMAETSFTVQSTAFSGGGLILSIGAALFLAIWWGRHILRGRRARHPRRHSVRPAQPVVASGR